MALRRQEIKEAVLGSIEDHFPPDVAARFRIDWLDGVARRFQDVEKEDRDLIDEDIRRVTNNTAGRTWDFLADDVGEFAGHPEEWLLAALGGRMDYGN
jgi:hypothetical protein